MLVQGFMCWIRFFVVSVCGGSGFYVVGQICSLIFFCLCLMFSLVPFG